LLPGDVEESGEAALLSRGSRGLRADVLVVAHHGGRTSSTRAFLDAVRPGIALLPIGYRNRYRFPHADVLSRLAEAGATTFDTARDGAISVKFDGKRGIQGPRLERRASRRIWRARN
jgi:competence protein ComEC